MQSLRALGPRGSRIDLHLHSRASTDTASWFLSRAVLPESFTEPATAYALAKRRGMDIVTLTDHNTISGALEIAHHPDVLIGVEVTALFPEDRVPLHVLAWGVDEALWADMDRARANLHDLISVLDARAVPFALAHPLHRVGGELTADHIERCLLLFPLWEGRNGSRPAATNEVACRIAASAQRDLLERLAEKHGIAPRWSGPPALTGGSDDHGGFDVAGTWTVTPAAATPAELVGHLRARRVMPGGAHGSGMALAHSVGSLAAKGWLERTPTAIPPAMRGLVGDLLGHPLPEPSSRSGERPRPPAAGMADEVLLRIRADRRLVRRYRRLSRSADTPARGHARLRLATGWLHEELARRSLDRGALGLGRRAEALAAAAVLALPHLLAAGYARAEARFAEGVEREFFGPLSPDPGPVPVVMLTDTYAELNGVAGTMRRLAAYASARPGCGMRVLSCGSGDAATPGHVDLPAIADMPVPTYGDRSWRLGVPSVLDLLDAVEDSGARVVHAATPGPMGLAGLLVARTLGLPFVTSHHTELARYALELTGDRLAAGIADRGVRWFHDQAARVYVPTLAAAEGLVRAGVPPDRLARFTRGADIESFSPEHATPRMRRRLGGDGVIVVLYVGRLSREKGVLRLAEAFRRAVALRPRLRLALVGDGPARAELGRALGSAPHRFLGPLHGAELAAAYASADVFCLPSATETFGQVVVEAGASGLPAIVVDRGGAAELVSHGESGLVVEADDPGALAAAVALLHDDEALRARLGAGGRRRAAVRPSWTEVFDDLVAGYPAVVDGYGATAPGAARRRTIA